jgi:hypothetical protein
MTVKPLYQQHLVPVIGEARALQACLPTCFYMLAHAYGYLSEVDFATFAKDIDWDGDRNDSGDWLRARLSEDLRLSYHVPIVSWWIHAPSPMTDQNKQQAISAGYRSSQQEVAWFEKNVIDWPLEVIVATGTPVIVTMKPGFASNKSVHAVILAALKDDKYEIIDPDARNERRFYSIEEIQRNLSPVGAASVVLPPRNYAAASL